MALSPLVWCLDWTRGEEVGLCRSEVAARSVLVQEVNEVGGG